MMRIFFLWMMAAAMLVLGVPFFINGWLYRSPAPAPALNTAAAMPQIQLYCVDAERIVKLPLDEYVSGVVSAEMPAEFPLEALKAQAVAARTYAVKQMRYFGGTGVADSEADISDSAAADQAWVSDTVLQERWGKNYTKYRQKIRQAVLATAGQIVCYDEKPISALFHAASAGRTASAEEVWGSSDYPYLTSVAAPEDKEDPRICRDKKLAWSEFMASLGEDAAPVSVPEERIKILAYTESGRVASLRAAGKILSGNEARALWGLRSTHFTAAYADGFVHFVTYGYGHGVGMSQYGAAALAEQGQNYREILAYFYRGTTLKNVAELPQ